MLNNCAQSQDVICEPFMVSGPHFFECPEVVQGQRIPQYVKVACRMCGQVRTMQNIWERMK